MASQDEDQSRGRGSTKSESDQPAKSCSICGGARGLVHEVRREVVDAAVDGECLALSWDSDATLMRVVLMS